MAHSSGFDLSHFTDGAQQRFGRQFAHLARDARNLSDTLSHYTNNSHHGLGGFAHDLADGARHQGAVAAHVLGKQAYKAGTAIRRDPIPTIVAVAGLACLVSLMMSSNSRR